MFPFKRLPVSMSRVFHAAHSKPKAHRMCVNLLKGYGALSIALLVSDLLSFGAIMGQVSIHEGTLGFLSSLSPPTSDLRRPDHKLDPSFTTTTETTRMWTPLPKSAAAPDPLRPCLPAPLLAQGKWKIFGAVPIQVPVVSSPPL